MHIRNDTTPTVTTQTLAHYARTQLQNPRMHAYRSLLGRSQLFAEAARRRLKLRL
jgi:hypothetical protein